MMHVSNINIICICMVVIATEVLSSTQSKPIPSSKFLCSITGLRRELWAVSISGVTFCVPGKVLPKGSIKYQLCACKRNLWEFTSPLRHFYLHRKQFASKTEPQQKMQSEAPTVQSSGFLCNQYVEAHVIRTGVLKWEKNPRPAVTMHRPEGALLMLIALPIIFLTRQTNSSTNDHQLFWFGPICSLAISYFLTNPHILQVACLNHETSQLMTKYKVSDLNLHAEI